MAKTKRNIIIALCIIVSAAILAILYNILLNKFSVPRKEDRIKNMLLNEGSTKMDDGEIASEIEFALSKYTNWDNLFLSEKFKDKFKSRKNIIDNCSEIADVWCGPIYEGENMVVVLANKKRSLFDSDESDDISTRYVFQYILNEAGEIDDLILIDKHDVYTMDGESIDNS